MKRLHHFLSEQRRVSIYVMVGVFCFAYWLVNHITSI